MVQSKNMNEKLWRSGRCDSAGEFLEGMFARNGPKLPGNTSKCSGFFKMT